MVLFADKIPAQGSIEQYTYMAQNKTLTFVPVVRYRSTTRWYAEARYNYEETNTFSLYAGKTFSNTGKLSYSITPLLGGVIGNFKGGSIGLNLTLDYRYFFFSSQSQYTFSGESESNNFLFSWSEIGYQPLDWFYFGVSAQHTYYPEINTESFEPGVVVGFEFGKWTFPIYCFSIGEVSRYLVLGINLDVGTKIK